MSSFDPFKLGPPTFESFLLCIQGQPKTSKTTLALSASKFCPAPSEWKAEKPVQLADMLWMQFEPNALMFPTSRGLIVPNVLDWSDIGLTLNQIRPAIKKLPAMAAQWRDKGITTIVVDTLSTFNRFLLREVIDRGSFAKDMERIRAYGIVDEIHYELFDNLRATKMNIIGVTHLQPFQPFGEDGGKSDVAADMKKQAEKAINKVEGFSVGGVRTEFIADCRPKINAYWTRLADAVLVSKPRLVTVRAGQQEMKYEFVAQPNPEFSAGGRWDLPPINDGRLYPHIEKRYGK